MSKPFVPSPVLLMVVFSTAVCIPIIILSRINFGLLSIWLNAAVAALILVHHFFFILLSWIHHRYPHLNIVGRPSTPQLISSSKTLEAEDEVLGEYELLPMPEIAYSIINVWAVAIIFIVNAVAFCVMVDITSRGAVSSTLPAERIGSHKWNIKIQIGQTSVLGVELLVLLSMLVTCIIGWRRYTEEKERIEAEIECGIALPV